MMLRLILVALSFGISCADLLKAFDSKDNSIEKSSDAKLTAGEVNQPDTENDGIIFQFFGEELGDDLSPYRNIFGARDLQVTMSPEMTPTFPPAAISSTNAPTMAPTSAPTYVIVPEDDRKYTVEMETKMIGQKASSFDLDLQTAFINSVIKIASLDVDNEVYITSLKEGSSRRILAEISPKKRNLQASDCTITFEVRDIEGEIEAQRISNVLQASTNDGSLLDEFRLQSEELGESTTAMRFETSLLSFESVDDDGTYNLQLFIIAGLAIFFLIGVLIFISFKGCKSGKVIGKPKVANTMENFDSTKSEAVEVKEETVEIGNGKSAKVIFKPPIESNEPNPLEEKEKERLKVEEEMAKRAKAAVAAANTYDYSKLSKTSKKQNRKVHNPDRQQDLKPSLPKVNHLPPSEGYNQDAIAAKEILRRQTSNQNVQGPPHNQVFVSDIPPPKDWPKEHSTPVDGNPSPLSAMAFKINAKNAAKVAKIFHAYAHANSNCKAIAMWAAEVYASLDVIASILADNPKRAEQINEELLVQANETLYELLCSGKEQKKEDTLPLFAISTHATNLVTTAAQDYIGAIMNLHGLSKSDVEAFHAPQLQMMGYSNSGAANDEGH
mmetsp:Transcript_2591/g.3852  ORF Transcript_2591/g.3852 Transcript_2591/m.3852 type:complete len:612 (+) Transcript_2591:135-1970(+)|eukprot:CAMPEP_0171452982 /NCGR_PEP_ID=MMETSP0945-20130129/875_1 /TAXON_ID=109269 /ORGANISM="Vaucheria litorea, Strain CCMP2940" /LENGTH=611 /DNA_ID=CAMNT_0011977763 /DNA_START=62 /DNA_END=1897 /DNA_ORIENTATION=+